MGRFTRWVVFLVLVVAACTNASRREIDTLLLISAPPSTGRDSVLSQSGGSSIVKKIAYPDSVRVAGATDSSRVSWNAYRLGGFDAGVFVITTDARLSDARVPLAHTQAISTITNLQSTLDGKEPVIAGGTTSQYWRGDKTWQAHNVSSVTGLSDSLSNHRTLINGKQPLDNDLTAVAGLSATGIVVRTADGIFTTRGVATSGNGITVTNGSGVAGSPTVALTYGSAANTVTQGNDARLSDARVPLAHTQAISTITNLQSTLDGKEPVIAGGTTSQYWRGDKTWQAHNVSSVTGLSDSLSNHRTLINGKQPLDNDLTAVAGLSATGIVVRTADGIFTTRGVATSGNGITVTNGSGVAGSPTVALTYGSAANTVTQGNDARLSDARVPLAHTQAISTITNLQLTLDGKLNVADTTPFFRKTGGVITGNTKVDGGYLHLKTNTNTTPLYLSRSGSTTSEVVAIGVDDGRMWNSYTNDESTGYIRWSITNTDLESGGGAGANAGFLELYQNSAWTRLNINDGTNTYTMWHNGNLDPTVYSLKTAFADSINNHLSGTASYWQKTTSTGKLGNSIARDDGITATISGGLRVGSSGIITDGSPNSFSFHDPDGSAYTYTQLVENGWGGSHALLWNAYRSTATIGDINATGMTKYANNAGAYSSGAAMISYIGNGGSIGFFISPVSTGAGQSIEWGAPKLQILRGGEVYVPGEFNVGGSATIDIDLNVNGLTHIGEGVVQSLTGDFDEVMVDAIYAKDGDSVFIPDPLRVQNMRAGVITTTESSSSTCSLFIAGTGYVANGTFKSEKIGSVKTIRIPKLHFGAYSALPTFIKFPSGILPSRAFNDTGIWADLSVTPVDYRNVTLIHSASSNELTILGNNGDGLPYSDNFDMLEIVIQVME